MMYASRTPPGVTRDQMCDPMCDVFVWREIWTLTMRMMPRGIDGLLGSEQVTGGVIK
jgi:hypothetical protein